LFCQSKIVYIESKIRFKDISWTAWILMKLNLLDLIVVRSQAISILNLFTFLLVTASLKPSMKGKTSGKEITNKHQ